MLLALLADATEVVPAGPPQIPFFLRPEVLMVLMGLFFVTVILPQGRRQRKEQEQLLATLKPGTKVVTQGGIVGTVVSVKDGEDEVTLRSADAKLKVLKSSVLRVLGEESVSEAK
jgi:preprotein translocase subunit YajC